MAFCEYSSEVVAKNSVTVDNLFISEFMPNAADSAVKVYLYGLYKCSSAKDNCIDEFEKVLNLSKEDIISIFYYWQEVGLVQVLDIDPIQVRYLPIKNAVQKIKKYNVDKYTGFNMSAQELMGSKMLTPRELEEFYYLIENLKMEKEAVLRIIQYAVGIKGGAASVNYVVTIAKNWAYDGVKTLEDVEERIVSQERISGDISLLLKAMGIKRVATSEEYQMYLQWKNDLDFGLDIITYIAKTSKSKNFQKLNTEIFKCYGQKLESEKEIKDYYKLQDSMMNLAKSVVKSMGLWYDNLSVVVDTYIASWLQLGFDESAILKLSGYAFKSSVRTLEGLNGIINSMFKSGVITSEAIDNYMEEIVRNDGVIKTILESLGINREVNSQDRNLYKTWLYDWGISQDLIDYGAEQSKDKYLPMQYLNKILSEYRNKSVTTVEEAKKITVEVDSKKKSSDTKVSSKAATKRDYSKKELDSLFDNIFEVEL
ncbi:MAG: DnaD domain protein [Clostridiales bacterium]|nr:DnaD domain protein [Clostridiales bacterium]